MQEHLTAPLCADHTTGKTPVRQSVNNLSTPSQEELKLNSGKLLSRNPLNA